MMNLDQEKRATFNSVAWTLILIGVFPVNLPMGLGFMLLSWLIFY